MTKLQQLIESVKEEGLTKDQLEQYHTEITYLDNLMRMELAPIEKLEAQYMGIDVPEKSVAKSKTEWRATEKGQRQIELNHYLKVTPKLLQSIKTRLYNIY